MSNDTGPESIAAYNTLQLSPVLRRDISRKEDEWRGFGGKLLRKGLTARKNDGGVA